MDAHSDPRFGYATSVGRSTATNQDRLGYYLPDDPELADLAGSIYVVTDGQGPPERGASLADRAIRVVVRTYYREVAQHGRARALERAIRAADAEFAEELVREPDSEGAGASVVAAVLRGEELLVGHLGSTRAYLIRDGKAFRLTEDDPDASLGQGAATSVVVSERIALGPGDRVLLSTDGLHGAVSDDEIGITVASHAAGTASQRLVNLANAHAAADSNTALVLAPFAETARPMAPAASAHDDISWRAVALGAGAIIVIAAVALFRPWEAAGSLAEIADAGSLFARQEPTVVPTQPPTAVAAAGPSTTPTTRPSPTASSTPTPAVITMPDLVGESADNARQAMRALGLELSEIRLWSAEVARDFVISQDPEPGTELGDGSEVEIAVSLGSPPPTTRVPPTFTKVASATPSATTIPTQPPPPTEEEEERPTDVPTRAPTAEPTKPPPPTPKPQPPTVAPPTLEAYSSPSTRSGIRIRGLAAPARASSDSGPPQIDEATPGDASIPLSERLKHLLKAIVELFTGIAGSLAPEPRRSTAPPTGLAAAGSLAQATASVTISPTGTITMTATATPTSTATSTPTNTPTSTNTPTPTNTATPTYTPTPTPTSTPKPAYLPGLYYDTWVLCDPPWEGIDDPEINDDPYQMPAGVDLCPGLGYYGRQWRPDGPPDAMDWFYFTLRYASEIRLELKVPPAEAGDYDLWLYPERRGAPDTENPLAYSRADPGVDERIVVKALRSGRYWIQVWGVGGAQIEEPYRIVWSPRVEAGTQR